jgi:hypothetical protein
MWRYENDNALSSAYASLHVNTSREIARYVSYPMPADYPDFPHHTQILAYLQDYVEHFGFREHIRFNTEVIGVTRVSDDAWEVRWRQADGELLSDRYAAVLVASGHHWDPRMPEPPLPGSFGGREIHSHFYRTAGEFEGMNVLVVGLGDSALDIACDTSRVSKMTFLTARRGTWILPKYLGSRPLGEVGIRLMSRSPLVGEVAGGPAAQLGAYIFSRWNNVYMGRPEQHGLPRPDHRFGADIAAVSSDLYARVGHRRHHLLHRLQHQPAVSLTLRRRSRGRYGAALQTGCASRSAGPALRRADRCGGPAESARRAAGGMDRRPARGLGRAAVERPDETGNRP